MDLEMAEDKVGNGIFTEEERQPWAPAGTLCFKILFVWNQGKK